MGESNYGFDQNEFAAQHSRAASGGFDPDEYASFHDQSAATSPASGVADTLWKGLSTNDPTRGVMAAAGRELPRMAGAALIAPAAAALGLTTPATGPAGFAAAMGMEGAGGAAGEVARQGVVAAAGNKPNLSQVPGAFGSYALGKPIGSIVKGTAGIAGELGEKALNSKLLGGIPSRAMDALKESPGAVLRAGEEYLPESTRAVRGAVSDFMDYAGNAYGQAKSALINKFGNAQVIPRKGLRDEMQTIIENSRFDPKAATDRESLRQLGRLVADSTKPFSGSVEGAINQSQRFTDEMNFAKERAVEASRSGAQYQNVVSQLKQALDRRIDLVDPEGNFSMVRRGYAEAQQLARDAGSFINAKNLPRRMETALANPADNDNEIIHRIMTHVPATIDAFNKMRLGIHGQYFESPIGRAAGLIYGYGSKVAAPLTEAAARVPGAAISQWQGPQR